MVTRSREATHQLYLHYIPILIKRFPKAFNRSSPLPLEIGVFEKLIALPNLGMCDDELETTLLCWTSRREYCRSAVLLGARYDLEGNRVEDIDKFDLVEFDRRYKRFIKRGML